MRSVVIDDEARAELRAGLDEIVREGARQMLAAALEAEADAYVAALVGEVDERGHRLVVRNGRARERTVTTVAGAVAIAAPRVHDRRVDAASGERQRFRSAIVPPWCRKSPQVAELLPLLYLHGLSGGDFVPALTEFFGSGAGLSASVITRLTRQWQDERTAFASSRRTGGVPLRRRPRVTYALDHRARLAPAPSEPTGAMPKGRQAMADPTDIARDYLEGWNRRDWDRWRELLHPEYSYTGGDGKRQDGPEAGMAVGQMFAAAFPDGKLEVRGIYPVGDDRVVAEFTGRGTHTGDLMGIAPTGKTMELPVCFVLEIRDGKIFAEREYMDMASLMAQLGVAAPAGATA